MNQLNRNIYLTNYETHAINLQRKEQIMIAYWFSLAILGDFTSNRSVYKNFSLREIILVDNLLLRHRIILDLKDVNKLLPINEREGLIKQKERQDHDNITDVVKMFNSGSYSLKVLSDLERAWKSFKKNYEMKTCERY